MLNPRVQTLCGLEFYSKQHKAVRTALVNSSSPKSHGNKIWPSSFFIIDYLRKNPPLKGTAIMDIGCGWGLNSIFCAKEFDAKVTAIDTDKSVFPVLKLHSKLNAVSITRKTCDFGKVRARTLAKQELIIGSDICFWDELVEPLFSLIEKAVSSGVSEIIIADPGREPFMALAQRCLNHFNATLESVSIQQPEEKSGYLLKISTPQTTH